MKIRPHNDNLINEMNTLFDKIANRFEYLCTRQTWTHLKSQVAIFAKLSFMKKYFICLALGCGMLVSKGQPTPLSENVFIITMDGFRWQELFTGADSALTLNKQYVQDPLGLKNEFWANSPDERRKILMPFFWSEIAGKGQIYGNRLKKNNVNCSNNMWFSYPGYNEILCGFADDARIKSNNKIDNPNITVLEYLNKQQGLNGKVAAFGSWDVFPFIINETRSGIPVNAGFEKVSGLDLSEREVFLNELLTQLPSPWSSVRFDGITFHFALEYLKKNKPRVVFISFGETDDFAHDGKYDAYLKSARQNDHFIKGLWDWVQSQDGYRDKTTFIITTDHGRGTTPHDNWRNHSRDIERADEIWFAFIGPAIAPRGEITASMQLYQNQLAKTAAFLLGHDYKNEKPVGPMVEGLFKK